MILFNKFSPFFYTFTTRFPSFRAYKNYLVSNILFPVIPLVYAFLLNNNFVGMLFAILLYVMYFYIFWLFYEIGYIWNDYFTIKKEKHPTIRINYLLEKKEVSSLILTRLLLGFLFISVLYFIEPFLTLFFLIILILMWFIFSIHNYVRNYFINLLTIFFLKTSRFLILISLLHYFNFYHIIVSALMYFFIDTLVEIILNNNMRVNLKKIILGNENVPEWKLPDLFFHSSMIFFCLTAFCLTTDKLHLFYLPYYVSMVLVEFIKFSYKDFNRF